MSILTGLCVPAIGLYATFTACYPKSKTWAATVAVSGQALLLCWFVLMVVDVWEQGVHTIAWLCMTGLLLLIAFGRGELRRK